MMRLQAQITLPCTPEAVWAVLSDWERQAEWMPDVAWLRVLGPGREVGARIAVRTKVLGVPVVTDEIRVIAWDPPHRLGVVHEGLVAGVGEWVLIPAAGGRTTIVWTEEITMAPPVLGAVALWLYGPVQRWMLRRSVRNLGAALRAGPT
jgi:carbon monoxide dehydrogenase subunit G